MTTVIISRACYEEISEVIETKNPYFFTERDSELVEVDINNREEFDRILKEFGWV